ncbi:MAG: GEVED domain-containing protein, partial [Chitinophagales bacterium]|nr:GEVED domain-containing protein [Chitinophagales bacterium]
MFNKNTKSKYAGTMKVLAVLLAFSVVSFAALRLYTPASSEATTETFVDKADIADAAMAPLACLNTSSYGSGIAPTICSGTVFTTCNYASDYATMTGAIAGRDYTFSSSISTDYLTIRQGTSNGTVIGEGTTPVTATVTASGNVYIHINTNAGCGTEASCRTTSATCANCPPEADYCSVTSTNTSYGIARVETTGGVADFNNASGSGQYTNYSATTFVSQYEGSPVTLTVSPVNTGASHGYGVWIDWNNNKCFETGDELIGRTTSYFTGNYTVFINIPAGTAPGDYRMRVVNNWLSSVPTACGDLGSAGYGEAEDYTFRVLGADNPDAGGGNIECLLVCSNDQTITLAAGACDANVNYLVTTIGNCPAPVAGRAIVTSQLTSYPTQVDGGLRCGTDNLTGWHSRAYVGYTQAVNLSGIDVASSYSGQQRVTIYTYTGAMGGQFLDKSQMTKIYESPFFNIPNDFATFHYDFASPVLIPANTNFVVEQSSTAGNSDWRIGYTFTGQTAKSYIACSDTANPEDYGTWSGGYPGRSIYQILYGNTLSSGGYSIVQKEGIPSGEVFPVGTTTNCFVLYSGAEAVDSCCFDITVNKYPNPSKTLVCNDYLYISADENCEVSLNADMFLEGGPYGCYDDYIIMIWPFGYEQNKYAIEQNKPLYIPLGEHMYEIIDPSTGNRCWGSFKIEDKLAPVVTCSCEDVDIIAPISQFTGVLEDTDPLYNRCGAAYTPQYYDVFEFQVSATGSYTFSAVDQYNDTYAYIYQGSFDPANPCNNVVAQGDDGSGAL